MQVGFSCDSSPFALRYDPPRTVPGLEPCGPATTRQELNSRCGKIYFDTAPRPPNLHDRQIPNPLPLAWMNPQNDVILVSSPELRVADVKGVSVP